MFELPPLPPPEKPPTLEVVQVSHRFDGEITQTFPMVKQVESEIAELPSPNSPTYAAKDPYAAIHPSKEYREAVARLITILSRTSLPGLLFKQGKLRELGSEISSHHIHTLKFLECILGDPKLKEYFIDIRHSSAKWDGFLWEREDRSKGGGTGGALDKLAAEGKIDPYLPGFAKALNADLATLKAYANKRDWEGMLDYLMK